MELERFYFNYRHYTEYIFVCFMCFILGYKETLLKGTPLCDPYAGLAKGCKISFYVRKIIDLHEVYVFLRKNQTSLKIILERFLNSSVQIK